jgi:Snf7
MKEINFDQLEDLRDEMDDMVMDSRDMNDLLNRDYACEVDDADLDAELQELDDGMFFAALDKKESQKVSEKSQDPYQEISNANTNQIKS